MACLTFWNEYLYSVEVSFVFCKIQNTNIQECSQNWMPCNFSKTNRIELRFGWQVADNRIYKRCLLATVKMPLEWQRIKARFHSQNRQILNFKDMSPRKFLKMDKWRPHTSLQSGFWGERPKTITQWTSNICVFAKNDPKCAKKGNPRQTCRWRWKHVRNWENPILIC